MYSEIAANKRKTWFIMFFFIVFAAVSGYFLSIYLLGDPSATVVVLIFAALYALFSYYSAGKMAVAVNGANQIDGKSEPRLYRVVENIAITNGMPMPKVYVMEDQALNAFATGRNPENAIVAATRGLLNNLDDSELEGVMAHEMGHVKNYDIRVSMIAFALVTVIALMADIFFRSMIWGGGNRDRNSGPLMVIGVLFLILSPIVAQLLKLAISRKREYLADATGALTTRYPEGLASALEKIARQGSATKNQNTATAHLFFANPLKSGGVSKFFSTHPPVEERIKKLRKMDLE